MSLSNNYSIDELKKLDVDFLGLIKHPWNFSRGAKTIREYNYNTGELAVKIEYSYTYTDDGRYIDQPTRTITFYDIDQTEFLSYDITKTLNSKQLKSLNREIRQGRMDYMDSAAADLPNYSPYVPEPYKTDFLRAPACVDIVHKYYKEQIASYKEDGTTEFENAIKNETNLIMLEVLNTNVRPPDALFPTGLTIKQTILHQLTGSY